MHRARSLAAGTLALLAGLHIAPACSTDGADAGGPSCANGARDEGEIGIDCGGTCATKCTGDGCSTNEQCSSGKCESATCAARVGKVCGVGVSTVCEDNQPCELDRDCRSGFCDSSATCGIPSVESHSDGKANGGETGVDCGGTVKATAPCPDGQGCSDSADCIGTCTAGICGPIGPTDGKKNNGETDIDCGGPNAPPCANGKACETSTDCVDAYCPGATNLCVAPRNDDGVQNGTETDIDCGGASGTKCAETRSCLVDSDCNGACNYAKKCVDAPSCKPKLGGATCGSGEVSDLNPKHESCCRSLPVPGFTDPSRPGKAVYLDKYEITAGRVRAFLEAISGLYAGVPNVKAWVAANPPPIWSAGWSQFLPSGTEVETISVPHKPTSGAEVAPWYRNTGTNWQFNEQLFVYVHGHNCGNAAGSYGYPTFYYPPNVQAANAGVARAGGFDGAGTPIPAQELLDVKSMSCIPNALLAAFCHWDGGQLATDEVLDFVTGSPASLGSTAGCGTRCAPLASVNATSDSGTWSPINYNFPYFADGTTSEGVARIASPGRVTADVVRINAADEPWMDLHGNLQEVALDVTGATFTGNFALKYRGIGYSSARAGGNASPGNLNYPEYKAGYSGGRCMRFK